jgi:S-adenosylmethionine:tRNA ribosyltransferase-isomerase
MIAATNPVQRSPLAKLLVVDACGRISHTQRSAFTQFLRPNDLVVANDAATLPASLHGVHVKTGSPVEVRLAGRPSLKPEDVTRFNAVIFGAGDFHTRTEDRPLPPVLTVGDKLALGPLAATIEELLSHNRFVSLFFEGTPDEVWNGLAYHGRPIQYAHMTTPLALWDVWTKIAGLPVALEAPSASFIFDWSVIAGIRKRGAEFATLTHAAGISSTGDDELDGYLPLAEPYRIPETTAVAIRRAKTHGGRIVAVGTSVVRALEHAATIDGNVKAGEGLATQHISAGSSLRVVDVIVSGTHEPGTNHYELLRAFVDDGTLTRTITEMDERAYLTHEFGDSVLIENSSGCGKQRK